MASPITAGVREARSATPSLESTGSTDGEDSIIPITRKSWNLSFSEVFIYRKRFHLQKEELLMDDDEDFEPEVERLEVEVDLRGFSGDEFEKLRFLKVLELSRVPQRCSAFFLLGGIGGLQCLTKLSIRRFAIRCLPPEIGCLKNLEELDLSFNKLNKLPNDIGELKALRSLKVANNKLVYLPSGVSSLARLETLDLSNNRLTSLAQLKLASLRSLQHVNLQYNRLHDSRPIASWMFCKLGGNGEDFSEDGMDTSFAEVNLSNTSVHRAHGNRACLHPESSASCRCSLTQRMKKGWKRHDNLQQRARQERLNYSRMWRADDHCNNVLVKSGKENDSCKFTLLEKRWSESQMTFKEEKIVDRATVDEVSHSVNDVVGDSIRDILNVATDCDGHTKYELDNINSEDESSCLTDSSVLNKENDSDNDCVSSHLQLCAQKEITVLDRNLPSNTIKIISKSKRHYDRDLDNPKPRKFRRPVDECTFLSCKYSTESFCGIDDRLPDGFYDAGRDRPFMSLEEYEQSLCLDSREVILLDRDRDEELDAIVSSAQILLSSFRRLHSRENNDLKVDNLQRASILALFVSDCFGGSDRSSSVMKLRKAVVGLNKQQPFICTCWATNVHDKGEITKLDCGMAGVNFTELCENSLRLIKARRNSNVVPIGALRFGVCRHRAVLLKYLCDRADPPIPCELVRGYLDFMPHAWNAIHVRRGNSWVRMVVDACYPTDIREETDTEYYCRYIPLCRINLPLTTEKSLTTENSSLLGCSFSSPPLFHVTNKEKAYSRSVFHCKFGMLDAVVKVRSLESCRASLEERRNFECSFLGEVRMLGTLRKHSCIVDIYGHQLSSKWAPPVDGTKENKLLQSIIVMEYVKGGSVKVYLEKLLERGEKHAPVDIALCIARDVAFALIELHSKHIIHRDIKSENILIDLDCNKSEHTVVVKLADFDRAVPLHSYMHTCCNAHLGIHPPDVCVGTPRWMAPEVVQAMHQRKPYGLEVDIWSYGCLIYELLTLQIPYCGQSEAELYDLLQMKRRPSLPPELDALVLFDEPETGSSSNADMLKLLVDLFYDCTSSDPSDRPTAQDIYSKLCEGNAAPTGSSSSSS